MIIQDYLPIKINAYNFKYYENLGFTNLHVGETILVKNNLVQEKSHIEEIRACDICGKEYYKTHQRHNRSYDSFGKDVCRWCQKYNKEMIEFKRNKSIATSRVKYGTDSPNQNLLIKQKKEQTYLEKYGETSPAKNANVIAKIKRTNNLKYGCDFALQNKAIRGKGLQTLREHGNILTSRQQYAMYETVKDLYADNIVELNYIYSPYALDVYLELPECKIDIEYDCSYYHNPEKDQERNSFLLKNGFKVLRFKSGNRFLSREFLHEAIEQFRNSPDTYQEYVLEDWKPEEY